MQQQLVVGCGLGVARQRQMAPVGGRQMDIDHLQGGELLQDRPRRESRRARPGDVFQGDVQAVGDERDEDVRLDPFLTLMEDRADRQVVLEFLERLLDLGQLHVVPATAWPGPRRSDWSAADTGPRGAGPGVAGRGAARR